MGRNRETLLRDFHQAKWDEEIIMEMSVPGERGILVPAAEEGIRAEIGDGLGVIPEGLRRKTPPGLPEVGQMRVLRHYMRLSQETLGADVTIDIGEGTCTM
jgi:glycine dehydrogenase subunit 2